MRQPTNEDTLNVLDIAEGPIENPAGERLYDILKDIDPEAYRQAIILMEDFAVNPTPMLDDRGKKTIYVYSKMKNGGHICPVPVDIDQLPMQYRRDMVYQIYNQMYNSVEKGGR